MSVKIKTEIINDDDEILGDANFIMDFDVEESSTIDPASYDSPKTSGPATTDAICPHCQLIVRNNVELELHLKTFHPNAVPARTQILGVESDDENVDDPSFKQVPQYGNNKTRTFSNYNSTLNKQTKNYFCSQCYFYSEQVTAIYEHMEKNKHIFQYKCNYCDKYFAFIYMIENHHKSCHKDDEPAYSEFKQARMRNECRFICNLCSGNEKTFADVTNHNKRHHKSSGKPFGYFIELDNKLGRPEILDKSGAPNLLETNMFKAATQTDLRRNPPMKVPMHNQNLNKNTPKVTQLYYSCNVCKKSFETHNLFCDHRLKVHNDENMDDFLVSQVKNGPLVNVNKLPKYYCLECSIIYYTTSEMKEHYKIHNKTNSPFQYVTVTPGGEPKLTEEATYKCSECAMFPDTLLEMKTHWSENHPNKVFKVMKLYTETPSRNYPCPHCDNYFYYKLMLQLHVQCKHSEVDSSIVDSVVPRIVEPPKNNRVDNRPSTIRTSTYQHYQNSALTHTKERTNGTMAAVSVANKYQCLYCTLCLDVFRELKDHHIKTHSTFTWLYIYVRTLSSGSVEHVSSEELIYKCIYCELDFGKNIAGLTNHYKEHHSQLSFKYKIAKGIDGFNSWQEHTPENVSLVPSRIKREEKEIKPDVNKLNYQMATASTSKSRSPKFAGPTTPRGRGRPRKVDKQVKEEIEVGFSHYGEKFSPQDYDDMKVHHCFNGEYAKVPYAHFCKALKLNPKVKVKRYN